MSQLIDVNTSLDDAYTDMDSIFFTLIPKVLLNQTSIKHYFSSTHLNMGEDTKKDKFQSIQVNMSIINVCVYIELLFINSIAKLIIGPTQHSVVTYYASVTLIVVEHNKFSYNNTCQSVNK